METSIEQKPLVSRLREQVQRLKKGFRVKQEGLLPGTGYEFDRGLKGIEGKGSVLEHLPTFEKRDLVETIREKVESTNSPVIILDIGCGTGRALAEIQGLFGDRVLVYGLTAYRHQPEQIPPDNIKVGDLSHINSLYAENTFDVIFSCRTLPYTKRHISNLYPKIYKLLKPEGIALLDNFFQHSPYLASIINLSKTEGWLKDNGYQFEMEKLLGKHPPREIVTKFSIRKTHPILYFPLRYTTEHGMEYDVEYSPEKAASMTQKLSINQTSTVG